MVENEGFMMRKPASRPYVSRGLLTRVSGALIRETALILQGTIKREMACFWLGTIDDKGMSTASALIIPKQINNPRNYSISSEAMQEIAAWARPRSLTNVAAIHSHPGHNVEHSTYDDEMTPSRRALSIVFPLYGYTTGEWPHGVGIHEFINDYWYLLTQEQAIQRVLIDDSIESIKLDLR